MGDLGSLAIKFSVFPGNDTCIILTEPSTKILAILLESINHSYIPGDDLKKQIVDEVIDTNEKFPYSSQVKELKTRMEKTDVLAVKKDLNVEPTVV